MTERDKDIIRLLRICILSPEAWSAFIRYWFYRLKVEYNKFRSWRIDRKLAKVKKVLSKYS